MTTSAQTAGPRPKYKRSIKNYMLDARFQLKWTGFIILVALVVSAIMGVFLFKTSTDVTRESQKVIEQGKALIKESQKNSDLVKMQIKDQYADTPELADTFNKSAKDLDNQLQERHNTLVAQQNATLDQQRTMLLSLVGGLTLLVFFIGVLGIYFTHKVVGPIYKMKLLLKQVGDGKLNFKGGLRKGDELQDFFECFAAMVEKLKDRQKGEVAELTAAMEAASASGASEEAIAKIGRVRDQMKAALDL
jgi:nitrogen fixation/metabolism regulation signal transduction histidine kinase